MDILPQIAVLVLKAGTVLGSLSFFLGSLTASVRRSEMRPSTAGS